MATRAARLALIHRAAFRAGEAAGEGKPSPVFLSPRFVAAIEIVRETRELANWQQEQKGKRNAKTALSLIEKRGFAKQRMALRDAILCEDYGSGTQYLIRSGGRLRMTAL